MSANIQLITKNQLAIINRQNFGYPLAIAEKDYFLAVVSKIIFNSNLSDKLIFKGGTALHHVNLPQLRFSEDLDFSSNMIKIYTEEFLNIFDDFNFLKIKKHYSSRATVKIEKLQYHGVLSQANFLKAEIDFLQNVVLSPVKMDYKNIYDVKTKVKVMDIREITAEKIRAMNDRARYRDFYDFTMIIKKLDIDIKEVFNLVKLKEIRKSINKENIINNWEIAKSDKQKDYQNIYFIEQLNDKEINEALSILNFKTIQTKSLI
jgi:predicted nucleotidyltransferase component of viral defense system